MKYQKLFIKYGLGYLSRNNTKDMSTYARPNKTLKHS